MHIAFEVSNHNIAYRLIGKENLERFLSELTH